MDLSRISESTSPDAATESEAAKREKEFYETNPEAGLKDEFLRIKVEDLRTELEKKKNFERMRDKYAEKAHDLVYVWTTILIVALLLQVAFAVIFNGIFGRESFSLFSDKVLIALITGITVNIVAVFLTVIRNLFPVTSNGGKRSTKS